VLRPWLISELLSDYRAGRYSPWNCGRVLDRMRVPPTKRLDYFVAARVRARHGAGTRVPKPKPCPCTAFRLRSRTTLILPTSRPRQVVRNTPTRLRIGFVVQRLIDAGAIPVGKTNLISSRPVSSDALSLRRLSQ